MLAGDMPGPPQVLMIDDSEADCRLVREMFAESNADIEFHSVPDGPSAFDFLTRTRRYAAAPTPDLIVVDLNLPILGGKKILNLIKSHPDWRSIPVVVLSASDDQADIRECQELGAEAYFVKPASVDDYLRVIKAIETLMRQLADGR
jgi:chemotaxis family two-component system response regulator Rcp1